MLTKIIPYYLYFFSKADVRVFLHKLNQFHDTSGAMVYSIYETQKINVQVNIHDIR